MPPADTYSPLQLCGSISHPTRAVMVTGLQMSWIFFLLFFFLCSLAIVGVKRYN